VDNFVENGPTSQLAPWDKVYKTQNIDQNSKKFIVKNQCVMNTVRGRHWALPIISAAKKFVYKSPPPK
jgi:hypothetical protein